MYKLLVLMAYRFHAYKSERLYKEKGNDAKAVGKFMQCLLTHFDATHTVNALELLTFRVFSNQFANYLG